MGKRQLLAMIPLPLIPLPVTGLPEGKTPVKNGFVFQSGFFLSMEIFVCKWLYISYLNPLSQKPKWLRSDKNATNSPPCIESEKWRQKNEK